MNQNQTPKNKTFSTVGDVLKIFKSDEDKYVSREFQKYAYELAKELNDMEHKSLYMGLAKNTPRALLENARGYVKESMHVNNRGGLFMWYLKKLKEERSKQ